MSSSPIIRPVMTYSSTDLREPLNSTRANDRLVTSSFTAWQLGYALELNQRKTRSTSTFKNA